MIFCGNIFNIFNKEKDFLLYIFIYLEGRKERKEGGKKEEGKEKKEGRDK